jgi:hypothetical protein
MLAWTIGQGEDAEATDGGRHDNTPGLDLVVHFLHRRALFDGRSIDKTTLIPHL